MGYWGCFLRGENKSKVSSDPPNLFIHSTDSSGFTVLRSRKQNEWTGRSKLDRPEVRTGNDVDLVNLGTTVSSHRDPDRSTECGH